MLKPFLVFALMGQPSVEILPTENVEKLKKPAPATSEDIGINKFVPKIQRDNEFASFNVTLAAYEKNLEVKMIVEPTKGQAILGSSEPKQILKGTTASFSGVGTPGYGVIKVLNLDDSLVAEIPYKIEKRSAVRQTIGGAINYSQSESETIVSQNARYQIGGSNGRWNVFLNVSRSPKSKAANLGFSLTID